MLIPNLFDSSYETSSGFRLQRFEILNWGTFHQCPWVLNLQGETTLLTGANGSGKSTLVDGLLTLLVPIRNRNYNQASTSSSKKERDEKSYIQGAYGRIRLEDEYGSKSKFLREKGSVSILLAYFSNSVSKQQVTLAQVLWIDQGSVKKFFVIANTDLSIITNFIRFTQIPELKKQLKITGAEIFDEFSKYSSQFRKQLGLQSEKALDLFSQTISLKEIGSLNEFVRNHMLEKMDIRAKIRELQESFENLTVSHEAIQKARKQLEILLPLAEESKKYINLKSDVSRLQKLRDLITVFFASKKFSLVERGLQIVNDQLNQIQHQYDECNRELEFLSDQEKELEFAIKQDNIGQRLQELKKDIEHCQNEINRRRKKASEYHQLAKNLDLVQHNYSESFYAERDKGKQLAQEVASNLEELQTCRDKAKEKHSALQKQNNQLKEELDFLQARKSNIPSQNVGVRNRIAKALNLKEEDLPFVGELLQVRPECQEWEGAIERLLSGFGLSLLVTDIHYQALNDYVNQTHLGQRLVYYKIASRIPNPTQRYPNPKQVPHKLLIKPDNPIFSQWLQEQLQKRFNYACCETLDQFYHEELAITLYGLIKHRNDRHEKDDIDKIGDRRKYILGWQNTEKIEALQKEHEQIKEQLITIEEELKDLEKQRGHFEQQKSWLQDFMKFDNFEEIDWQSEQDKRLDLEKQHQDLEASSNHLRALEEQLKTIQEKLQQLKLRRDTFIGDKKTMENRRDELLVQKTQCEITLQSVVESDLQFFEAQTMINLKKLGMTLDSIDQDKSIFQDDLQEQLHQQEQKLMKSELSLCTQMSNFKRLFPEIVSELETSLDYLEEYLELKHQIEQDDLPAYEKQFKHYIGEKIIFAISIFKRDLEKQEEDIEESIEEINISLRNIHYTDSTYIQLCCDKNRDLRIREFKEKLKACLGNVAEYSMEDNERRFQNIQASLIDKFKSEERWTSFVTDVRNWLNFSVSERYYSDNREKEHHTDSSGKSGGQKVKLAYTILASAIAYQFGLNQDESRHKSFRLVIIDEAFSKLDDSYVRYAMELFKSLNLQLLVVTPKDKINVIEPYLSSLHIVSNTLEENYSSIYSMSIDEYHRDRQISLGFNHD